MTFIPPRALTDSVYRGVLSFYGGLAAAIGTGITITSSWDGSTVLGACVAAAGLIALSVGLFFNTTEPGDPLSALIPTMALGGLGIGCWTGRIDMGVQTRHATRTSVPARRRQDASGPASRRLRDRMR
jgi:hypothetical protein